MIAATGGTVTAGGATLTIPAGALSRDTTITVSISSPSSSLPDSATVKGSVFDFGPDGTTFSTPATLTLPMAGTPAANERAVISFLDAVANRWVDTTSTVTGAQISAPVSHFTGFAQRVVPPVERLPGPTRKWEFLVYSYDQSFLLPEPEGHGTQVGGEDMFHHHDFGEHIFDIDDDGIASLEAYSSASGITFWVSADAPLSADPVNDDRLIYSESILYQYQSFIKHADDATLRLRVTEATMEALDKNGTVLSPHECIFAHLPDGAKLCDGMMQSALGFRCEIYFENQIIAPVAGKAFVHGWAGNWDFATAPEVDATPLFTDGQFDFDDDASGDGSHPRAALKVPLDIFMPLALIPKEKEFTLACALQALVVNARGRESGIGAYLRDPQKTGGTAIETTGLEATNNPLLIRPPPEPPPVCMSGPDPAAGVLQFSSATYSKQEVPFGGDAIVVTRTQGSVGAVSATFTTSDGTAVAGVDYTPVSTTVHFGDGDTAPRVVPLTILLDRVEEPDKTVTVTLSEPGGCATLGPQSSAMVTILDDDGPVIQPTLYTVGGTVNGLIGTLVLENHRGLFLEIFDDGPFTFSQIPTPSGEPYFVRVFNQPHNPVQTCTVANGTGVFTDHNVTDVVVTCVGQ